ncbi:MAG: flagellar M-ring protein FliF [Acidimicrobiales bacterium]|nr:flagellar M-ring protein FliF [Acidimicrobiales bacterium]
MALDLNVARERATRTVKSFSPQQMLILAGLSIVSIMGLIALMRWVSQPSYAVLVAGAQGAEVSKVTAALNEAGVTYQLGSNGASVLVANDKMAAARAALSDAGVNLTGQVPGYELLDKQSMTTSEFQQRVDLQRALEGELTNMLLEMDAVDSAKVQLSLPEKALFADDQQDARASVLVGTNARMDSSTVRAIMQTVASAVPDLDPDNVTVTDTTGRILSVDGMSAGDDPMQMARKYEAATAAQAQSMLDTILGPGRSVVRVSAEMDFNQIESKSTTYSGDPKTVGSQTSEESFVGPGATIPAGVIGVTGTTLATGEVVVPQEYTKTDTIGSAAIDSTETVTRENPGKVKRLSVAVAVDQAALDTLGANEADLEALVIAAVGADTAPAPDGRGDVVELKPQTFDTAATEAAEEATKSVASAQSRDKLIGYAQTGGALVVLLLSLVFLRKGLKGRADEVDEIDTAVLARSAEPFGVIAGGETPATANAATMALAVPNRPGSALAVAGADEDEARAAGERRALDPAHEVLDLIDREPDDVAALLRSWVADRRS